MTPIYIKKTLLGQSPLIVGIIPTSKQFSNFVRKCCKSIQCSGLCKMDDLSLYSFIYWIISPDSQLDIITDTEAAENEENSDNNMPENGDTDLEEAL